jgi:L-asparaginase
VLNDSLILPTPSVNSLDNNIQKVSANLATIAQNINQNSVIQFLLFPAYYNSTTGASLLVSMLSQLQSASPQVKGIIFESFGSGNIPDFAQMQTLLQGFNNKGTIMVDCTQVYSGEVNYKIYATGAWLKGAGVIGSYDMIPTAALTKLVVQLALNPTQVRTLMATNLAGEITSFYALSGYQNEFLVPGESLFSINGNYQLTNEVTGTLALYDISGTTPQLIWSQANGAQGRLVMQADCNLVFYNKDFQPLWSSGTQQIGTNAVFQVNSDGSLSINDLYTGALISRIYPPNQIALAS